LCAPRRPSSTILRAKTTCARIRRQRRISHFFGAMRVAAAVREGDMNIMLSNPITAESRMMIRRNVKERLEDSGRLHCVGPDPYLVITDAGRLVWMVTATPTPMRILIRAPWTCGLGRVNYMRNAVKATIDAYDGTTRLYIFAPDDPIVRAYQRLVPGALPPRLGDAGGPAQARALSGDAVPRAGGDLPDLSHARSAGVL
jgi:hypothetical protein